MKICIGTANFNRKYGLNKKKLSLTQKKKIFGELNKQNIKFLDTANAYKSDSFLNYNKKFNIITKLSSLKNFSKFDLQTEIESQIKNLTRFKPLYAVLLHDCKDMFSKNNLDIYKSLLNLKKKKMIKKIGISCYNENDLQILKKFNFDIIQFPLNIFDQRILKKKNLMLLKNKELHVRSIFLQGLLLKDKNYVENYFSEWSKNFDNYYNFLKKNNLTSLECCLRFIKQQKIISKIVLGVENINQLNQIIKIFKKKYSHRLNFKYLKTNDKNLILPFNWRLN